MFIPLNRKEGRRGVNVRVNIGLSQNYSVWIAFRVL